MNGRALARRQLLERIYDKMTDEERRTFALLSMQDSSAEEILRAIAQNRRHLERIVRHTDRDKWWVSFGSDVAANLLTGGAAWLARKVFGR